MDFDKELELILRTAKVTASSQKREYLTPEEILYNCLCVKSIADMFDKKFWPADTIKKELMDYVDNNVEIIKDCDVYDSSFSDGVQNVIDDAISMCLSSDRDKIRTVDIILSIYDDEKLYASYILRKNGIERLELLEVITEYKSKNFTDTGTKESTAASRLDYLSRILPVDFRPLVSDLNEALEDIDYDEEGDEDEDFDPASAAFLNKYCINLNKKVKDGLINPIVGRDEEIDRTIQILCRYTKNNPIYVGDAGVGKTSIVEGLACLLVNGEVPSFLKNFTIYSLDMTSLLAGTKFRGDLEERIQKLTDILLKMENTILFIDEIHQIVGAGSGNTGSMDAANLLKPVLSDSKVRCIGATTYDEYNKIFTKDSALSRRFQKIDVEEPSREKAIEILKLKKRIFEEYHGVKYSKDAIESAVDLSVQYINDRKLPDKAIDLLDESGVYAKLHKGVSKKKPTVSVSMIKKVVSKMSMVPVEDVNNNEKEKLEHIETSLSSKVFGQDEAVKLISLAVKKSRAGFRNPDKAEGIFLFVGPTGVGKTELTKVLSDFLGEKLLRFDMSEYQEKHTVSRLIGSPPGYVGFEEGGLLTDAVRKNPHSVVLFDEIEKAHPDIYNILLQVMDYGTLTDNQGRKADFRNTIIIMTSNAGAREIEKGSVGFGADSNQRNAESTLREAVDKSFTPEFRNRLDAVIPFNHLDRSIVNDIARSEINKIAKRLEAKKVTLKVSDDVVSLVAQRGYSKEYGARNISRRAEEMIATPLVDKVLFGSLAEGGVAEASVKDEEVVFSYL